MVSSDRENQKSIKNKPTKQEIGTKQRRKPTISTLQDKLKLLSYRLQTVALHTIFRKLFSSLLI
jgi:hypothetical protein